jgi:hypothetical protein
MSVKILERLSHLVGDLFEYKWNVIYNTVVYYVLKKIITGRDRGKERR